MHRTLVSLALFAMMTAFGTSEAHAAFRTLLGMATTIKPMTYKIVDLTGTKGISLNQAIYAATTLKCESEGRKK
jgi:hypothetical protein